MNSDEFGSSNDGKTWQCVLVCWGTKYGVDLINKLVSTIGSKAASVPKFVLVTDVDKAGLVEGVCCVNFPEYWIRDEFKKGGCQAKLVIFESGILRGDLPTVYVDLDTIVLGDLSDGFELMKGDDRLLIFQSGLLPVGFFGRLVKKFSGGRRYARANSSLIYFWPNRNYYISERFKEFYARGVDDKFMMSDDRFISFVAQNEIDSIPKSFAVKFPDEYMSVFSWILRIKADLPWVKERRSRLVAVTLNGVAVKPEVILKMPDGEKIVDARGRVLVWSEKNLGFMKGYIRDYYSSLFS